ncbi:MAG TPA: MFS transporter [Acetobacteraceae bacterium]|nr:MFS transporter [Acetobacteraceae bacterium]
MPFGSADSPPPEHSAAAATLPVPPSGRAVFLTVFPSIMLPMFMAAVDQTIVATALPAIGATLGDLQRVSWVVVGYLVANTIAAPVYGRLGDAIGRRRMMFAALGVFVAASLFCAASTSVLMLSFARVLQGLGGGGLMTLSQALIAEAVPPRQRGRYQGYLSGMYAAAATFGPVVGGWLTQHYGWRSVFLVNLPLGVLAVALVARLDAQPVRGGRIQFDVWGTILFAAVIAPTLLALERAQRFSLSALPLVALLVACASAALVALLRQERRAPSPLLPVQMFRQPGIWRTDLMAACTAAQTVSMVSFLPMYLEVVRGEGAEHAGLLLLPLTLGIAIGSLVGGRTIAATGRTAIMPSIGLAVSACMLLSVALFAPAMSNPVLIAALSVLSLATGPTMPVVQMTVQVVAGPKFLGAAAASVQFSRSIGAAFGTALVGAVLFAALAARDPATAASFTALAEQGPRVLAALPAARRAVVQGEIADAFRAAFLTISTFTAGGMAMAWWLPVRRI